MLGQTSKQSLTNSEPQKPWKYRQLRGLRSDPSCLRESKLISMKLCTRIIDVKNGVRKCNSVLMSGFFWKIVSLLPLQILGLSLKRRFSRCGHRFGGCDRLGGFGKFDGHGRWIRRIQRIWRIRRIRRIQRIWRIRRVKNV